MEETNNTSISSQPIETPPIQTPTPKLNIFKYLFIIFLGLFSVVSLALIFFLTNSKKSNLQSQNQTIKTTASIPTVVSTIDEKKSNTLKISDIQIDLPTDWIITSVSGNTAKILIDYKPYQVYLILNLNKGDNVKIIDSIGDNILLPNMGKYSQPKILLKVQQEQLSVRITISSIGILKVISQLRRIYPKIGSQTIM